MALGFQDKNGASAKRRIVVVDDHSIMREGLAHVINRQDDLIVCAEAGDVRAGYRAVMNSEPDLVLLDISLEGESGLELIKDICAVRPATRVLVLSMHDESLYAERALRAGARGYVMKKSGGEAVLQAIRTVLSGDIHVSKEMSAQVLARFSRRRPELRRSKIDMLTDREFEVFELIGRGNTSRQISDGLRISPNTVGVYRQRLREKFNASDSASLILKAVRWVESQGGL
jgi:DNA-binding NarL/FixJ family response regulator